MSIRRVLLAFLLTIITIGCGMSGPGPSPTPEGQIGPGEPDASGIPKTPSKGGVR